jgi:Ice-binding-like
MSSKRLLLPAIATLMVVLLGGCKKDINSNELPRKTSNSTLAQQAVVNLGLAGNFVILSKSGITNVPNSVITGDIGTSPITGAAITGITCPQVIGAIYTVDDAGPACKVINPTMLTTAVLDMQAAYTDAAGRTNPDFTELGAGIIGGLTLTPGLYKWSSTVSIPTDVTISGGPDDVWIFQVAGTLTMASAVKITLIGGAQAKNIFWAIAGATTFGTTSHFEGIILAATNIAMQTGATMNGRMLAQTAVTLQMNTVTQSSTITPPPPPPPAEGCTYGQGYWKTHTPLVCSTDPLSPLCIQWPAANLTLGTVNSYDVPQLVSIFTTPPAGNGLISLAHQLIAAKLNIAHGSDGTAVAQAIIDADNLIGSLVIPPVGSGSLASGATSALVATLSAYNEGATGPGHCE